MNKIYILILVLAISAVALTSCEDMFGDFLDKDPSNELTEAQVFSQWTTAAQFHIDTYSYLRLGVLRIQDSWLDAATDLAQTSYSTGGVRTTFNIGNYYGSAGANELTDTWAHYYEGIRKCNIILTRIDNVPKPSDLSDDKLIKTLTNLGMQKDIESIGSDIFFNGRFIGHIENYEEFISNLKEKRRKGELPMDLSIRYNRALNDILLSTEVGRVLRPLIIVKDGKSSLTEEHLELLAEGSLKWDDLLKNGIIEYLDAAEEENSLVAISRDSVTPDSTHLEIDKIDLLGVVTSLVPYANYDQSSRLNRGSKTQKQGLGLYAANFLCRIDTDVNILHYPQRPIVRSFVYDTLNVHPAGQNVVVAVMTHEGYNIEDALILNKASVERGFARSTYYRPYTSIELNYAGGLRDEICVPEKDISGYRTEESYRFLEDDGICYLEAKLLFARFTFPVFFRFFHLGKTVIQFLRIKHIDHIVTFPA